MINVDVLVPEISETMECYSVRN